MSTRRRRPIVAARQTAIIGASAALLVVGLPGCAGAPPVVPSSSSSSGAATSAPDAPEPSVPAAPALVPDGTAAQNLPFFASIIDVVWASEERGSGRAYVDALVANGFDKARMQVTEDLSTVGNAAESMQVSVVWAGECLVGQFGSATGEPNSTTQALLPGDVCLLGSTRPIDW